MTNDQIYETSGFLMRPPDPDAPQRAIRLRELGLGQGPDAQLDEFARQLALAGRDLLGLENPPFAMVNFVTDKQYLGGLYIPIEGFELSRENPLDHGYCPHVVVRKKALVLDDVCDYPRFAGNPLVDKLGIRTYVGAPLMDDNGQALGTVCLCDSQPLPWGHPGLELIKGRAAELTRLIHADTRPAR